jgi:hypothetical protein
MLHRPIETAPLIGMWELLKLNGEISTGVSDLCLPTGIPLFKRGMIIRELPSEFFAEGRFPNQLLNLEGVHGLCFLSVFPSPDTLGAFPLHFHK